MMKILVNFCRSGTRFRRHLEYVDICVFISTNPNEHQYNMDLWENIKMWYIYIVQCLGTNLGEVKSVISYMKSYHVVSCRGVSSCRVMSSRLVSYRTSPAQTRPTPPHPTPHQTRPDQTHPTPPQTRPDHIASHRIASHIISYQIISYHIMYHAACII